MAKVSRTYRFEPSVVASIERAAGLTGWTETAVVELFVKMGFAAVNDSTGETFNVLSESFHQAVKVHRVEEANAKELGISRERMRELRRENTAAGARGKVKRGKRSTER